jgi:hypothetical protein
MGVLLGVYILANLAFAWKFVQSYVVEREQFRRGFGLSGTLYLAFLILQNLLYPLYLLYLHTNDAEGLCPKRDCPTAFLASRSTKDDCTWIRIAQVLQDRRVLGIDDSVVH